MKSAFKILAIAFILSGCEEKPKEQTKEYQGPLLETENINVVHTDSGFVKIKMSTAKQMRYANGEEVYPKTVYVTFIDNNGVEYTRLRGDSARFIKKDNLYVMKGNVLINNTRENQSLETDELFWNPSTRKIYSEKKVRIKTPKEDFTALKGMDADQDFSRYQLRQSRGTAVIDSVRTMVPVQE